MNKNTKKFVVTLLSVLMVLSFMPTVAFAATAGGEFNAEHEWDTESKNWTEIIAPTCTSAGIVEKKCVKDGGICNATHVAAVAKLGHTSYVSKRFDTAADFAAALVNDKILSKEDAAAWLAGTGANVCYGYADVCSVCGALKVREAGPNNLYGLTATEHKEPDKTKDCAASFTCGLCGKENAVNSTHNETTSETYHTTATNLDTEILPGKYCITQNVPVTVSHTAYGTTTTYDTTVTAWEQITASTCKECKKVVAKERTIVTDPDTYHHTGSNWWDTWDEPIDASKIDHSLLTHNMKETVTKEPTCSAPGEKASVCEDCGYEGPTKNIQPLAHDYSEKVSVPATVLTPAYSYMVCKYCKKVDADSYEYTGKPLSTKEDYTLEVLKEKTCEDAGIVKATLNVTISDGTAYSLTEYFTYDLNDKRYEYWDENVAVDVYSTDKDYFTGFLGELDNADGIEIPDIKPTGHTWGKAGKVADATCLTPEKEAMTCTICGCLKHSSVKNIGKALGHTVEEVVVPPTCGVAGYTYKVCTRCNEYLDKNGKSGAEQTTPTKFEEPQVYNKTAPVVKLGAECKFDTWKVIKEATADEDGSKILVCSVCGQELAGSETVIPADTDAKKDQEIEKATPVIAAAAAITADKYTADSAKAVAEAKAALNQAIASGTAADVTRATAALQKAVDEAVEKAANPMVAKAKTVKAKANKKTTIKAKKAFTVKKAQGKVTYAKKSGNGKITVSKAGKVTVKKGLKAGKTYKVKVQIKAAGNGNYLAKTKTVTLKVKVK